jgi:hypothetical protein
VTDTADNIAHRPRDLETLRVAAYELHGAGLTPRDIATALALTESAVRSLLRLVEQTKDGHRLQVGDPGRLPQPHPLEGSMICVRCSREIVGSALCLPAVEIDFPDGSVARAIPYAGAGVCADCGVMRGSVHHQFCGGMPEVRRATALVRMRRWSGGALSRSVEACNGVDDERGEAEIHLRNQRDRG